MLLNIKGDDKILVKNHIKQTGTTTLGGAHHSLKLHRKSDEKLYEDYAYTFK